MSNKYQSIIKKHNKKVRRRVKLPQKIEDYITNLTIDLKSIQNNLTKIDTVRWEIYQAWDSLRDIIRILNVKEKIKIDNWKDVICSNCKYVKRMLENLAILEMNGTITGEKDHEQITFDMGDWKEFISNLEEKVEGNKGTPKGS